MGQVFAAVDAELGRAVALKIINPGRTSNVERARVRFQREAQALARLRHPSIVAIYDIGEERGRIFIAMELVEGVTLEAWMQARRPWPEVVGAFVQAGKGLESAHGVGIVHRDFKPANVIVGEGRVVVVDFGIARTHNETPDSEDGFPLGSSDPLGVDLTMTGERVGTPRYMAPEQVRGEATNARSDQYSFCVTLWEGLHGERPAADPIPVRRDVPGRINAALRRGLLADPSARWPSMGELLAALSPPPIRFGRLVAIGALMAVAIGVTVSTLAFTLIRIGEALWLLSGL